MKFSLTKYSRGADYSRIASSLVENSPNNRVMAGTRGSIPIGGNCSGEEGRGSLTEDRENYVHNAP